MIRRAENYTNILNTYKKGLLKKLIKSNINGDNEKIAKTILGLFSFL